MFASGEQEAECVLYYALGGHYIHVKVTGVPDSSYYAMRVVTTEKSYVSLIRRIRRRKR